MVPPFEGSFINSEKIPRNTGNTAENQKHVHQNYKAVHWGTNASKRYASSPQSKPKSLA